jgi:tRNA1Val (adenine37-N6)-methyltransferase
MANPTFRFKQFELSDTRCAMKIGTDGVLLGAWADCGNVKTAIDVGTGSGLLALMIAQRATDSLITALEIDEGAAADARDNIAASVFSRRINVIIGDFAKYRPTIKVDLIVSNPPYFTTGEHSADTTRATARHQDGLTFENLARYADEHLSPNGSLALVAPFEALDEIIYRCEMSHLKLRRQCTIYSKADKEPIRVLCQFYRTDGKIEQTGLIIRQADNSYSADFAELTKDFYLNF